MQTDWELRTCNALITTLRANCIPALTNASRSSPSNGSEFDVKGGVASGVNFGEPRGSQRAIRRSYKEAVLQ